MSEGVAQAAVAQTVSAPVLLHAEQVDKNFYDGGRVVTVLNGLDLDVAAGRRNRDYRPVGRWQIHATACYRQSRTADRRAKSFSRTATFSAWMSGRLAEFRNQSFGFVFQFDHLLADFSALENVDDAGPDRTDA